MTENERKAIDVLQDMITEGQSNGDVIVARGDEEELKTAIQALEEIQQYRAIGTIEEFKDLKEKAEAKKPILNNPKIDEFYVKEAKLCPSCHSYINDCSGDYCRDCGQKLDWSE